MELWHFEDKPIIDWVPDSVPIDKSREVCFEDLKLRLDEHLLPDLLLFSLRKCDLSIHNLSLLITGLDDADAALEVELSLDTSASEELDTLLLLNGFKSESFLGFPSLLLLSEAKLLFFLLDSLLFGDPSESLLFSLLLGLLLTSGLSLNSLLPRLLLSLKLVKFSLLLGSKFILSHLFFDLSLSLLSSLLFSGFSIPFFSGILDLALSLLLKPLLFSLFPHLLQPFLLSLSVKFLSFGLLLKIKLLLSLSSSLLFDDGLLFFLLRINELLIHGGLAPRAVPRLIRILFRLFIDKIMLFAVSL